MWSIQIWFFFMVFKGHSRMPIWYLNLTGWCFFFLFFHILGMMIIPTDELIFFRGVGWNHQPDGSLPCRCWRRNCGAAPCLSLGGTLWIRRGCHMLPWSTWALWGCVKPRWGVSPTNIELNYGKIYRKALYLMVKTMVSCKISLKPIQWNKHGNFNLQKSAQPTTSKTDVEASKTAQMGRRISYLLSNLGYNQRHPRLKPIY